MKIEPIDIIRTLNVGEHIELHNFNGDVLDDLYTPANKEGIRISISKQNQKLIVTRKG